MRRAARRRPPSPPEAPVARGLGATLRTVLSDDLIAHRATDGGARFAAEPDGAETADDVIVRRIG